MYPFYFMGDMYNDSMPLGLSSTMARGLAAYEYFTALGETELARRSLISGYPSPDDGRLDRPDPDDRQAVI